MALITGPFQSLLYPNFDKNRNVAVMAGAFVNAAMTKPSWLQTKNLAGMVTNMLNMVVDDGTRKMTMKNIIADHLIEYVQRPDAVPVLTTFEDIWYTYLLLREGTPIHIVLHRLFPTMYGCHVCISGGDSIVDGELCDDVIISPVNHHPVYNGSMIKSPNRVTVVADPVMAIWLKANHCMPGDDADVFMDGMSTTAENMDVEGYWVLYHRDAFFSNHPHLRAYPKDPKSQVSIAVPKKSVFLNTGTITPAAIKFNSVQIEVVTIAMDMIRKFRTASLYDKRVNMRHLPGLPSPYITLRDALNDSNTTELAIRFSRLAFTTITLLCQLGGFPQIINEYILRAEVGADVWKSHDAMWPYVLDIMLLLQSQYYMASCKAWDDLTDGSYTPTVNVWSAFTFICPNGSARVIEPIQAVVPNEHFSINLTNITEMIAFVRLVTPELGCNPDFETVLGIFNNNSVGYNRVGCHRKYFSKKLGAYASETSSTTSWSSEATLQSESPVSFLNWQGTRLDGLIVRYTSGDKGKTNLLNIRAEIDDVLRSMHVSDLSTNSSITTRNPTNRWRIRYKPN
jgi:hypothetical protein